MSTPARKSTVGLAVQSSNIFGSAQEFFNQMQPYEAAMKEICVRLESLDLEFKTQFCHNPIHHLENRIKSPDSIIDKMQRKGIEMTANAMKDNVLDIAGVRVICNYIDDIYTLTSSLISQDDLKIIKKTDYIQNPKPNGYRSLHIVLAVPVYRFSEKVIVPVEIQVRTIAMDFWASLEHQLRYKSKNDIPSDIYEQLNDCAETISDLDVQMQKIFRALI